MLVVTMMAIRTCLCSTSQLKRGDCKNLHMNIFCSVKINAIGFGKRSAISFFAGRTFKSRMTLTF